MHYFVVCPGCNTELDPFKIDDNKCSICGVNLSLQVRQVPEPTDPNSTKIKTHTYQNTVGIRLTGVPLLLANVIGTDLTRKDLIKYLAGEKIKDQDKYFVNYSISLRAFCNRKFGFDATYVFWAILNIGGTTAEIDEISTRIQGIEKDSIIGIYLSIINFFKGKDGPHFLRIVGLAAKDQYFNDLNYLSK
jgi:hypothetical protein